MTKKFEFNTSSFPSLEGEKRTRNIAIEATLGERNFLKNWWKVTHRNNSSDLIREAIQNLAQEEDVILPSGYFEYSGIGSQKKLIQEKLEEIKSKLEAGASYYAISDEYKIDPSYIFNLVNGKRKLTDYPDASSLDVSKYPRTRDEHNSVLIMLLLTPSELKFLKEWQKASERENRVDVVRDAIRLLAYEEGVKLPEGYFKEKFVGTPSKFTPEVLNELRTKAEHSGNIAKIAREYGINKLYLYRVLGGVLDRNPLAIDEIKHINTLIYNGLDNDTIAQEMNLEPVVVEQIRRGDIE